MLLDQAVERRLARPPLLVEPARDLDTQPEAGGRGTHTLLLDDATAFLVEPTAEGLASGFRAALDQPEERAARARRGRELIERAYGVERYREKIARALAAVERLGER